MFYITIYVIGMCKAGMLPFLQFK